MTGEPLKPSGNPHWYASRYKFDYGHLRIYRVITRGGRFYEVGKGDVVDMHAEGDNIDVHFANGDIHRVKYSEFWMRKEVDS